MALRIFGIERSTGEYEGNYFDKWVFHVIDEERSAKAFAGEVAAYKPVKVKVSQLGDVFGGFVQTDADLRSLIGSRIMVFYDQYKNPMKIDVLD